MFERILIRRTTDTKQATDLGALAEALLFYQHADWLLDQSCLHHAVQLIGVDNLITLFSSKYVTPTFVHNTPIVENASGRYFSTHRFGLIEIAAHGAGQPKLTDEARIASTIARASDGSATASQTGKLLELLGQMRLGVDKRPARNIEMMMKEEVKRPEHSSQLARLTVEALIPGFHVPADWRFGMREVAAERYVIATNYDFGILNELYHKVVPPERGSITAPFLAASLLDARVDLDLATQYGIELMTDAKASSVIQFKIADTIRRRAKSEHQISTFQELTLNNARAVGEAINSGERSFGEFIALLERAERFKAWLASAPPEVGALTHYYAKVCGDSWVDRLPGKSLRYSVFTGAGILADLMAPGLSQALGAADTFLFDSILRGWKPNHFVDSALVPFADHKAK